MYNLHTVKTVLNRMTELLRKEPFVEGVLLVGSGAKGFPDEWMDLDLLVVVEPAEKTRSVFEQLNKKLKLSFEIYRLPTFEFGPESFLSRVLLSDFMEIDLGVVSLANLQARKEAWKILFENSDRIAQKMTETWHNRKIPDAQKAVLSSIQTSWRHIKNAAFAIKRSQPLRALKEMEILRNEAVELWGMYEDKTSKEFREVDAMRADFKRKLLDTYHLEAGSAGLVAAHIKIVQLYFWVIKEIDAANEAVLEYEKRMSVLLREIHLEGGPSMK